MYFTVKEAANMICIDFYLNQRLYNTFYIRSLQYQGYAAKTIRFLLN